MRSGFLIVNKAPGARSSGCVNALKKVFGGKMKVGHGGTLDSTASGVLVLLLGKATRASQYVMMLPKIYNVSARFGISTDTDDHSGSILSFSRAGLPEGTDLDRALLSFYGLRDQVPPSISAIKVKGRRAHSITRGGGHVDLSPRPVFVEIISRTTQMSEDQRASFRIKCHRGTYIRSIVRDLGEKFGCGAVVEKLQRESIGPFSLGDAIPSSDLEEAHPAFISERIISVTELEKAFISYRAEAEAGEMIFAGRPVQLGKLRRVGWGSHFGFGNIMITGDRFVSFAVIEKEGAGCYARPVTTIPSGDLS